MLTMVFLLYHRQNTLLQSLGSEIGFEKMVQIFYIIIKRKGNLCKKKHNNCKTCNKIKKKYTRLKTPEPLMIQSLFFLRKMQKKYCTKISYNNGCW